MVKTHRLSVLLFFDFKKKLIYSLIVLFLIVGLSSCTYNKEEILYPDSTNSCDTANVTFRAKIAPILSVNCLSCHGNSVAASNGSGIRLEDYSDVKARLDRVYGAILHNSGFFPMPKGVSSKIDECQITKIRIWKDAGGLDN